MLNDALFYFFCLVNLFCSPPPAALHYRVVFGLLSGWVLVLLVMLVMLLKQSLVLRQFIWLHEITLIWSKGTFAIICTLLILE
jgi:hypothetical protein